MKKTTKCGICGYEFTYDDRLSTNVFTTPNGVGAEYYYNLWHYFVACCPQCGYASKDISHTFHRKIVQDEKYQAIEEMELLQELYSARPNKIGDYLKASYYYESIGDTVNEFKCLLQASDLVFAEIIYWEEYIYDPVDSVSSIIGKTQIDEFRKFADNLFNSAISKMEEYVKNNPDDLDIQILLAGTLGDGDKIQMMKSVKLLNSIKSKNLTDQQKNAVQFLMNSMM